MTREILFRGFHEDKNGSTTIYVEGKAVKGEWVEGLPCYSWEDRTADKGEIKLTKKAYIGCIEALIERHNRIWAVIPSTVGQFTGLNDKNGRKIFEGDKAKVFRFKNMETGIVRHNSRMACFDFMVKHFDGHINSFLIGHCDDIEVTGTIFDKEDNCV